MRSAINAVMRDKSAAIAWVWVAVVAALIIVSAVTIYQIHESDWDSALGGLLGGVFGFLGAAPFAFLLFRYQVRDETRRTHVALVREVTEFSRIAADRLQGCADLKAGIEPVTRKELPRRLSIPPPIIYPAVARQIADLPSAQLFVHFYNRLVEVEQIVSVISGRRYAGLAIDELHPSEVAALAEAWILVCQIAEDVLSKESLESPTLADDPAIARCRELISDALHRAREAFPDSPSFKLKESPE